MTMHTRISTDSDGEHIIHGMRLTDLIRTATFTDALFLLHMGRMPSVGEKTVLDAILVSAVEHGIEAPSLYVPRVVSASGNSVPVSIAAGILSTGSAHGAAGEQAATIFVSDISAENIVANAIAAGEKIPGFGHKVYTKEDPRALLIEQKVLEVNLPTGYFDKAHAIESLLEKHKGKKFPLNIDGAIGAAVLSLGLPPVCATTFFVIARTAGMSAHVIEEKEQHNSYYRLSDLS